MNMKIIDATCSLYANIFTDDLSKVLQINAVDLEKLSLEDNDNYNLKLNTIILSKWIFKIRSTINTYNNNTSISNRIVSMDHISPITYQHNLKNEISNLKNNKDN